MVKGVWYGMVWSGVAWYGTARHRTTRYGMVWYGLGYVARERAGPFFGVLLADPGCIVHVAGTQVQLLQPAFHPQQAGLQRSMSNADTSAL